MSLVNVTPAKGLFRNVVWYFRKQEDESCFVKVCIIKTLKIIQNTRQIIIQNFFLPGDLVLYCPSISRFVSLFHQSDKKFTNYSYRGLNVNSFHEWLFSQFNSKFIKLLASAHRPRIKFYCQNRTSCCWPLAKWILLILRTQISSRLFCLTLISLNFDILTFF